MKRNPKIYIKKYIFSEPMNELSLLLNLLYIKFIQDFQGILLVLHRIQNHSKLSVVCPRFKPVTGPASK